MELEMKPSVEKKTEVTRETQISAPIRGMSFSSKGTTLTPCERLHRLERNRKKIEELSKNLTPENEAQISQLKKESDAICDEWNIPRMNYKSVSNDIKLPHGLADVDSGIANQIKLNITKINSLINSATPKPNSDFYQNRAYLSQKCASQVDIDILVAETNKLCDKVNVPRIPEVLITYCHTSDVE